MKKTNYQTPQIEVVEIEIETAILVGSQTDIFTNGFLDIEDDGLAW